MVCARSSTVPPAESILNVLGRADADADAADDLRCDGQDAIAGEIDPGVQPLVARELRRITWPSSMRWFTRRTTGKRRG